jgi:hypothetical protein
MMSKFLKDVMTGIDGESYDIGRVTCFFSFLVYFGLAIGGMIYNHTWDPLNFSTGAGAMAVGFGANLKLKSDTEPKV